MRKSQKIVFDTGRDAGKIYLIEEMSAAKADNWAMRALFALISAGGDPINMDPRNGMAGIVSLSIETLSTIRPEDGIPLLNELLDCVNIVPSGGMPRPINTDLNDVEDFTTFWSLRKEVFKLHTDFLQLEFGQSSKSTDQVKAQQSSNMSI